MKPDISEFSYGYAVVEQMARDTSFNITAAPVFPSLIQEGHQGGYDVAIQIDGVPLFLQFKLSDYLFGQNAKEANNLGLPYYRMHIRSARYSDQHAMLLELEKTGELVYYAAPLFHHPEELNDAYLNHQIIQRSILIKPSIIGILPDDKEHYVVFNENQEQLICSKPREVDKGTAGYESFFRDAKIQIENGKRKINDISAMEDLKEQIIKIVSKSKEKGFWKGIDLGKLEADRKPIEQAAYLARTFLGCEMLILRGIQ